MGLRLCTKCNKSVSTDVGKCPFCGVELNYLLNDIETNNEMQRCQDVNVTLTEKCPKCGADTSEAINYCTSCGLALQNSINTNTMVINTTDLESDNTEATSKQQNKSAVAAILLLLAVIIVPLGYLLYSDVSNTDGYLTMEKFNKISIGMTYNEVSGIIGKYGTKMSEAGASYSEFYTVTYSWAGKGSTGANGVFMFQGGKLISKAQYGLK